MENIIEKNMELIASKSTNREACTKIEYMSVLIRSLKDAGLIPIDASNEKILAFVAFFPASPEAMKQKAVWSGRSSKKRINIAALL